jgi:signal transduction histidine kinase
VLSHELRAPLSSIRYAAYILGSEQTDAPARHRAQALMDRQVRRMTRLADDILDVSRTTAGHIPLQCERIDLRAVAHHAIETLEREIRLRHHHLTVELPGSPVWLQGDPGRLMQVLVNLLGNASKYTNPGGELAVRMHREDCHAIVQVQDSGIGIAASALPHIFELFMQTDEALARCTAGLGVGLALVRSLVERHGGRVTACSAGAGRGSEFTVILPAEDRRRHPRSS